MVDKSGRLTRLKRARRFHRWNILILGGYFVRFGPTGYWSGFQGFALIKWQGGGRGGQERQILRGV